MLYRALTLISFPIAMTLAACSSAETPVAPPPAAPTSAPPSGSGPVLDYDYKAIDGRAISTTAFKGHLALIGFFTTYDVASQAQAKFLAGIAHHHRPRVHVAALFLEPPENAPLVTAYASALGLKYPLAIADADTIAGHGPFAGLHHVPSVVLLDREGRELFRRVGVIDEKGLEEVLSRYER